MITAYVGQNPKKAIFAARNIPFHWKNPAWNIKIIKTPRMAMQNSMQYAISKLKDN